MEGGEVGTGADTEGDIDGGAGEGDGEGAEDFSGHECEGWGGAEEDFGDALGFFFHDGIEHGECGHEDHEVHDEGEGGGADDGLEFIMAFGLLDGAGGGVGGEEAHGFEGFGAEEFGHLLFIEAGIGEAEASELLVDGIGEPAAGFIEGCPGGVVTHAGGLGVCAGVDDIGSDFDERVEIFRADAIREGEALELGVGEVGWDDFDEVGGGLFFT